MKLKITVHGVAYEVDVEVLDAVGLQGVDDGVGDGGRRGDGG